MSGPHNSPDMPSPEKRVLLGRIGAAHGIRGEVKLSAFTENPLDILAFSPFKTDRPDLVITISSARPTKNVLVAKLKGITDRTAAERLNGVELFVTRDQLPVPKDEDDFYHADLIGLDVRLSDGTPAGKVIALSNFGAGDLIEIGDSPKSATLYPFTRAVIPEINIKDGFITLIPPAEIEVKEV
jgi:16S rRNA processing protein RimM